MKRRSTRTFEIWMGRKFRMYCKWVQTTKKPTKTSMWTKKTSIILDYKLNKLFSVLLLFLRVWLCFAVTFRYKWMSFMRKKTIQMKLLEICKAKICSVREIKGMKLESEIRNKMYWFDSNKGKIREFRWVIINNKITWINEYLSVIY